MSDKSYWLPWWGKRSDFVPEEKELTKEMEDKIMGKDYKLKGNEIVHDAAPEVSQTKVVDGVIAVRINEAYADGLQDGRFSALAGTTDREMICEAHPWLPWPHGKCGGPGCPVAAKDVLLRDRISGLRQAVKQRETIIADFYHATADVPPEVTEEMEALARKAVMRIKEELRHHETHCKCPACVAIGVLYGYHVAAHTKQEG